MSALQSQVISNSLLKFGKRLASTLDSVANEDVANEGVVNGAEENHEREQMPIYRQQVSHPRNI